jgi:hypothetical protein
MTVSGEGQEMRSWTIASFTTKEREKAERHTGDDAVFRHLNLRVCCYAKGHLLRTNANKESLAEVANQPWTWLKYIPGA